VFRPSVSLTVDLMLYIRNPSHYPLYLSISKNPNETSEALPESLLKRLLKSFFSWSS